MFARPLRLSLQNTLIAFMQSVYSTSLMCIASFQDTPNKCAVNDNKQSDGKGLGNVIGFTPQSPLTWSVST